MPDKNLSSRAYDEIRRKIIYAELAPGTRLSAVGLEKETGIGRTPIREAFVRLREQELVETRPKSGTYVSKINMVRAENACFLRSVVERRVAVRCCSVARPSDLDRMRRITWQGRRLGAGDERAFFENDNLFHEQLYRIAGRSMVWDWLNTVNTHLERYRWLRVLSTNLDWGLIRGQHERLLAAIENRDTDEADYLTSAHLHLMPEEQGPVIAAHPDYFA